jgi:hypothetical protein
LHNGFSAAIKIKNSGASAINSWSVSWQYTDDDRITNSWNATLNGSNPYRATNFPGILPTQSIEFG